MGSMPHVVCLLITVSDDNGAHTATVASISPKVIEKATEQESGNKGEIV